MAGVVQVKAIEMVVCPPLFRQGKHIVMSNDQRIITIPRHNPVNAFTMGGIARDAGLTVEQFRALI